MAILPDLPEKRSKEVIELIPLENHFQMKQTIAGFGQKYDVLEDNDAIK